MSNDIQQNSRDQALILPAFGKSPELYLEMSVIREAEQRLIESKTVSPVTFTELNYTFNESYRLLKQHLSNLGFQLTLAEKELELAKADVLFGAFAEYMQNKPKIQDNSDTRKAFYARDSACNAALDRINQLKAIISNFEGKVKVLENTVKYMKQKMYLVSSSGLGNDKLYTTYGRK